MDKIEIVSDMIDEDIYLFGNSYWVVYVDKEGKHIVEHIEANKVIIKA